MKPTTHNADYSQLKWQFALENSNIGIWDFNADLNRVFYSKESMMIIGFDNEEFGANPNDWNDRVHPDDREQYFQDFQDHLKGLNPIYENEHRVQCKNGVYKWIADKGKIVAWDDHGYPKRIIGTHTDITERKKRETQLASSLNIITSQNKRLRNFTHIVSHNLRTHSSNFQSIIQFYDEANSNREKAEFFEHLKTVSESLSNTIDNLNELVDVQEKSSNGIEEIILKYAVDNTVLVLSHNIDQIDVAIINNIPASTSIYFNRAYMESILQNLLTNAIKYRKPNIKTEIKVSVEEKDDVVVLKVSDNGIGIDLETYGERLFGMYNTFHNKTEYDSRGIGLYLTKNQLEAFGATIEVESNINVGSTFIVTFKK